MRGLCPAQGSVPPWQCAARGAPHGSVLHTLLERGWLCHCRGAMGSRNIQQDGVVQTPVPRAGHHSRALPSTRAGSRWRVAGAAWSLQTRWCSITEGWCRRCCEMLLMLSSSVGFRAALRRQPALSSDLSFPPSSCVFLQKSVFPEHFSAGPCLAPGWEGAKGLGGKGCSSPRTRSSRSKVQVVFRGFDLQKEGRGWSVSVKGPFASGKAFVGSQVKPGICI